jgi:acyl carrier protein
MIVRGTVCVESGDTVENLDQAMLWGLGRVFEQEHPESWGGIVDIEPNPGAAALDSMIATLATPSQERYLAIRGERIWAQRLRRHSPTVHDVPARFWAGSHLITGGTGGLGLQLAEWLARRGVPHLVLASRRGLAGPGAQKIVTRIERSGVRVTIPQADISDRAAMAGVIEAVEAQGPPLRGVFHCAGIADFNVLLNQTAGQFQRVLAPKVVGAWTLHELTKGLDLDAFVLYSSVASILCAAGQGAYATANSFLDALSAYRRQLGLPGSSVSWGPWLGAGMSSMMNERQGMLGMPPLRAGPALAALERILADESPHVMVADLVWSRFRTIYEASGPRLLLADMEGAPESRSEPSLRFLQELAGIPSGDRERAVVLWLQRQVAEILGWNDPAEVDPGAEYFDLGMDSLTVVELCTQIQCHLRLMISPAVVFEHDNLDGLARHILALHTQRETHER